VRILDLSAGGDGNIVEEIAGFPTLMQANAFARRYVRASLERCRAAGMSAREVLACWAAFGEDCEVVDAGAAGWRSSNELAAFAEQPAEAEECDWRSLDPRREAAEAVSADDAAEDEEDGEEEFGEEE
jgi:hypothetical protein